MDYGVELHYFNLIASALNAGFLPMILVVSCVIAADTYLAMPKDAKGQDKILQIWLQARGFC